MKTDRIRDNLDACLRDVRVSAALHNEIMYRAVVPSPRRRIPRPRKLIVAVAVIAALLLTTAAAVTIAGLVREKMEPVKQWHIQNILRDSWRLEDKLHYVDVLEEMGVPLDEVRLTALRTGDLPDEMREQLAGQLIWDCIAAHRLAVYGEVIPDPADQPEPYPIPDSKWLFEMLWYQNDPGASTEEIQAAYGEWFLELHAALPGDTPVPENMTDEQKNAALLKDVEDYMADVMSMSRKEREAAVVTAELNEAESAWQVVIRIKGSELRAVTRAWLDGQLPWGEVLYDRESDTYVYPWVFTADGRSGGCATLEEYEWENLIPREAWPEMPAAYADYPYFDPLKCFLYAPAGEKAAFSRQWKPVVDAWLREHPAYEEKLIAAGGSHPQYRITRHRYGMPPESFLQEEKALYMAVMHSITLRPEVTFDQLMNRFHHILSYDVCDPENPLWRVELSWDAERALPGDRMADFTVIIDPETGRIIADQRTLPRTDAHDW